MNNGGRVVTVFGSSRPRPGEEEYLLAEDLGRELAAAGFAVCTGGYAGIMEASARGAKSHSTANRTIGVVCAAFPGKRANRWIDEIFTSASLVERMMKLIELGDAYVVLKGGTGTLLEFAAVWEFMNKNLMPVKPIILVGSFWNDVVRTLKDELAWEGLEDCTRYVTVVENPAECVRLLVERTSPGIRTSNG